MEQNFRIVDIDSIHTTPVFVLMDDMGCLGNNNSDNGKQSIIVFHDRLHWKSQFLDSSS
jgi:hypothetical protein